MAKRNELKQAKITVEIGGKKVRKSIYYRTVEEYAEKKKALLNAEKEAKNAMFKDVAEQWQTEHDETVELYTANCYKRPVKDCIEAFGDRRVKDIEPSDIQAFLNEMGAKKYAKQTINLRRIVLHQVFDYAIYHKMIQTNPVDVCKVPKKAKASRRELPTDADIAAIMGNNDSFIGLFCSVLIYTGMRKEEALALTYEDIDFSRNLISVSKALIFDGNKGTVRQGTKSDAGNRKIPLLKPLRDLLDECGTGGLFYVDEKPINRSCFNKRFAAYKAATGITCTCHQLRHYFCTICFEANIDEKDLQSIMGHSKVSLSKDIYAHIRTTRQQQTFDKLNAAFQDVS